MTIAMLSLAGFPATAGFFGKIYLIEAAVDNEYAFLGVAIVLGSAISLAYYLRVVAAVWMLGARRVAARRAAWWRRARRGRRSRAGRRRPTRCSSAAARRRRCALRSRLVAVVCAAATIAIGVYPEPLFNVARDAARR